MNDPPAGAAGGTPRGRGRGGRATNPQPRPQATPTNRTDTTPGSADATRLARIEDNLDVLSSALARVAPAIAASDETKESIRSIAEALEANGNNMSAIATILAGVSSGPPRPPGAALPPPVTSRPPAHESVWDKTDSQHDPALLEMYRPPPMGARPILASDITKAEPNKFVFGDSATYNPLYHIVYNLELFLRLINNSHKDSIAKYLSVDDYWRGNNSFSQRRRFESITWSTKVKPDNPFAFHASPGSNVFVVAVDSSTLTNKTVEVTALSAFGHRVRTSPRDPQYEPIRNAQKIIADWEQSVQHLPADDFHREMRPDPHADLDARMAVVYPNVWLAGFAKIFDAKVLHSSTMINEHWPALADDDKARLITKTLRLPESTTRDSLRVSELLPQFQDKGHVWDDATHSYVPVNPLYQRHLVMGKQEFEVTAAVIGHLYMQYLNQRPANRAPLDCQRDLEAIMEKSELHPNLFAALDQTVRDSLPSLDKPKLQHLRAHYRTILSRFRPDTMRFRFLAIAVQELNYQLFKYGGESEKFPEKTLISDIMDICLRHYSEAPVEHQNGYVLHIKALAKAWDEQDTIYMESRVNAEFVGVFDSLRLLIHWCQKSESLHAASANLYSNVMSQLLASHNLFDDSPSPGQLHSILPSGDRALHAQQALGVPISDADAHARAAAQRRDAELRRIFGDELIERAPRHDTAPDHDDAVPALNILGGWSRRSDPRAPRAPPARQQLPFHNTARDRELASSAWGGSVPSSAGARSQASSVGPRRPPTRIDQVKGNIVDALRRHPAARPDQRGRGAGRLNEFPNAVRVGSFRTPGTESTYIPKHTWMTLIELERKVNEVLNRKDKPSSSVYDSDMRDILRMIATAKSKPQAVAPSGTAAVTFGHEPPYADAPDDTEYDASSMSSSAITPGATSDPLANLTDLEKQAVLNITELHPDIMTWSDADLSHQVHLMIDQDPVGVFHSPYQPEEPGLIATGLDPRDFPSRDTCPRYSTHGMSPVARYAAKPTHAGPEYSSDVAADGASSRENIAALAELGLELRSDSDSDYSYRIEHPPSDVYTPEHSDAEDESDGERVYVLEHSDAEDEPGENVESPSPNASPNAEPLPPARFLEPGDVIFPNGIPEDYPGNFTVPADSDSDPESTNVDERAAPCPPTYPEYVPPVPPLPPTAVPEATSGRMPISWEVEGVLTNQRDREIFDRFLPQGHVIMRAPRLITDNMFVFPFARIVDHFRLDVRLLRDELVRNQLFFWQDDDFVPDPVDPEGAPATTSSVPRRNYRRHVPAIYAIGDDQQGITDVFEDVHEGVAYLRARSDCTITDTRVGALVRLNIEPHARLRESFGLVSRPEPVPYAARHDDETSGISTAELLCTYDIDDPPYDHPPYFYDEILKVADPQQAALDVSSQRRVRRIAWMRQLIKNHLRGSVDANEPETPVYAANNRYITIVNRLPHIADMGVNYWTDAVLNPSFVAPVHLETNVSQMFLGVLRELSVNPTSSYTDVGDSMPSPISYYEAVSSINMMGGQSPVTTESNPRSDSSAECIARRHRTVSLFDTCASGCFEATPGDCIPGISSSPTSGDAGIATAGHMLKVSEVRLKRDNHLVNLQGVGPAVLTTMVSPSILPGARHVSSITSGPLYKRLKIGLMSLPGEGSTDNLLFGQYASGDWITGRALIHQSNGLPLMELVTEQGVAELARSGVPRYHAHLLPALVPYDDSEAARHLDDTSQRHKQALHLADRREDGFFPEAIAICCAMFLTSTDRAPDADCVPDDSRPAAVLTVPSVVSHMLSSTSAVPRVALPNVPDPAASVSPRVPDIMRAFQRELTVGIICAGLGTSLFRQKWLRTKLGYADASSVGLDIRVMVYCEVQWRQRQFAARYLDSNAIVVTDIAVLVQGFRDGSVDPSEYYMDLYEVTPPCIGNTPLRGHVGYDPPPEARLFLVCIEFLWWVRPKRAVIEMTPSHGNDYENHVDAICLLDDLKLNPTVFSRVPSCYTTDVTHRDRFVTFTADEPCEPFDIFDYLTHEPRPLRLALLPPERIADIYWLDPSTRRVEFTGVGGTCESDDRYAGKHDVGKFKSRSRVAAYLDESRDKEDKVYDINYPAPTFTSYHLRIYDSRRLALGRYTESECIRFVLPEEMIRASSFHSEQRDFLLGLDPRLAMKMIAGAVPGGLHDAMLTCMIQELVNQQLRHSSTGDKHITADATSRMFDTNDAQLMCITGAPRTVAAADEYDRSAQLFFNTHLLDFHRDLIFDFMENRAPELNYLDNYQHLFASISGDVTPETRERIVSAICDGARQRPPAEPPPRDESIVVKAHGDRITQSRRDWPRLLEPNEPGYDEAFLRANLFHRTHLVAGARMERIIAMHHNTGMKAGDSRYVRLCDDYMQKRDSIPRQHTTSGTSSARLPPGTRPGQRFMIDGGDAGVRSIFGLHRYFLVFICVKSAKKFIVYLKNNNARSFVEAISYVRRVTKTQTGEDMLGLYGDYFSTHRDYHVLGALREELGVEMEVAPGYMHHLNAYAENFIRQCKNEVRCRLRALVNVSINNEKINDKASSYWNLAMEHWRQATDIAPSHTLERDLQIITCPEAVWRSDPSFRADLQRYHPFGAACNILTEPSQRAWHEATLHPGYYMFNGQYNNIVHQGSTSPNSHVILRDHNRLQITGKVDFTYRKALSRHVTSHIAPTPTDPTMSDHQPTPEFQPQPMVPDVTSHLPSAPRADQRSPGFPLPDAPSAAWPSLASVSDDRSPVPIPTETTPAPAVNRVAPTSPYVPTPTPTPAPPRLYPARMSPVVFPPASPPPGVPASPAVLAPVPASAPATAPPPASFPSEISPSTLRRSTRAHLGVRLPDRAVTHSGGSGDIGGSAALRERSKPKPSYYYEESHATFVAPRVLPVLFASSILCDLYRFPRGLRRGGVHASDLTSPAAYTASDRECLLTTLAQELELGRDEYLDKRTLIPQIMSKERPPGAPTRDSRYGENTDVHETILSALMDQLHFTTQELEHVVLQIDYNDHDCYRDLKVNGHLYLTGRSSSSVPIDTAKVDSSDRNLKLHLEEHNLIDLRGVTEDDKPRMIAAIAKEVNDLVATGCFTLVEMPYDRKAIHSRIVLKVKYKADGEYDKHKARLVAKGFMEKLGSDFFSTYSPMASLTTARTLMAIAVHYGLDIFHSDIPQAFIKATLDSDTWLRLPPGIKLIDDSGNVHAIVKLVRSLYGLRAAPQHFNKVLVAFMEKCKFTQCAADTCLFHRQTSSGWVLVCSEVDDLLITGTDDDAIAEFKRALEEEFSITDYAPIKSFLGLNINYNKTLGEMTLDVQYKIDNLFAKHKILPDHMQGKHHDVAFQEANAAIPDDTKLSNDVQRYVYDNYASLNGMLIYMGITCRPDMAYALSKTSKGMHDPKPKHVAMLIQLLGYVYRCKNLCLVYSRSKPALFEALTDLSRTDATLSFIASSDGQHVRRCTGFADANYANLTDEERKSNTGFIFFVFGCAVSWKSKLQPITATSTHEAELIACATAACEAAWMRKLFQDLGFVFDLRPVVLRDDTFQERLRQCDDIHLTDEAYALDPLWLFNDNLGTTQTINNPDSSNPGTRHVDVRYFRIRQWVRENRLRVSYVGTNHNIADFFTKGLEKVKFRLFRGRIGMREL